VKRLLYRGFVCLALPFALALIGWRGLRDRGYWRGLDERFGFGARSSVGSIWVHAVSVGEVQAAAALVQALREAHPGIPLALTTTTATGAARARVLFGTDVQVRFLPFDTTGSVRRFFDRVRPLVAIVVEKEVWPNLYHECGVRRVPLVLASAALAPHALERYRRLVSLFAETLARGMIIAAQTEADAARFRAIGANPAATHVIGNLKFDLAPPADAVAAGEALRARHGWQQRCVLVGGSTYEEEEEALLQTQRSLRAEGIDLALVLAPRHPPRFDAVADRLRAAGVNFLRQSTLQQSTLQQSTQAAPAPDVLLLDSIGELPIAYAAADIAFVGGSLVAGVGGHNLLEPAALGVATLTGPYGYNAPDIVAALRNAGALGVVAGADSLTAEVRRLAGDAAERTRRGEGGRRYVAANRGTLQRLLMLLQPIILTAARAASASR
jgi:3-deoxy-D-manno-octulosonic-acid transferase